LDDGSLSSLLAIFVLIVLHAVLTMANAALMNVRLGAIRELAENGNKQAERLIEMSGSSHVNATYQLLIMLLRFAVAGLTVLVIADAIVDESGMNALTTQVIAALVSACVMLVFGDLVPEAVGSTYANNLAMVSSRLFQVLNFVFGPLSLVLLKISQIISSLFKSSGLVNTITEEEIMSMVDAGHSGGSIEDEEKDMIYSVLQLDQTRVSEMMIPRIDIVAVDLEDTLEAAREKFVESGFSRIPVYEDSIDRVKGVLYAKDLLEHWRKGDSMNLPISQLMRPASFVPETKSADELLKELQFSNVHLAVVVDEYGGTAGLVTIEDIIEEIIGDIRDEYDLNEEADYEMLGEGEYIADSGIDLDDLNELLNIDLPTTDMDTLGGYLYTHFGRVPLVGETVDDRYFSMRVKSVEGRRIRKVHIVRKRPVETDDQEQEPVVEVENDDE
jgi:putative hemolysin